MKHQERFNDNTGIKFWCTPFSLCYGYGDNKLTCSMGGGQIFIQRGTLTIAASGPFVSKKAFSYRPIWWFGTIPSYD